MSRAAVDFGAIPGELKLLERWVVWRYERRGDKRTKVPYAAKDQPAKVTDPATWRSFDACATELLERGDRYDGVGLVVAADDGLTVWDFDHVFDPKTLKIIDPEVAWAVETLASYTEVTPSGEGLRVLCHGTLPRGRNRRMNYEGYSDKRYVTITGNRLGDAAAVEPRQDAIDRVFARLLKGRPDPLGAALADPSVHALWNARTDEDAEALGYGSHSEADLALCRLLVPHGTDEEVAAWFRQSGLYRPKWERRDYRERTLARARELAAKDGAASRRTDLGSALRFVELANGDLRYCHVLGGWFAWTGTHFARDRTDLVSRQVRQMIEILRAEAVAERDPDEAKAKFKHAVGLDSHARILSMLALAHDLDGCFVLSDALDADRALLNVRNGTLELSRDLRVPVALRPHARADLLTRTAPVEYDPKAKAPRWEKFVNQIASGDRDLVDFLQVMAGYSMTGYATEQKLFYLYGAGANGKTTFVSTLGLILGRYAAPIETSTLLYNRNDPHPTGLADFRGLNLAIASELPPGRTLNEDVVKRITGGERLKARRMYQDFFEFENHAKLWVYGNDLLHVRGTNHAIWRRMVMVPFVARIPAREQIANYWETLYAEEASGIFNWILEGFEKWREHGLEVPASCIAATEEYQREEDTLGFFLRECCAISGTAAGAYTDPVYAAYVRWSERRNERPLTAREFAFQLKTRGIAVVLGHANRRRYAGLELLEDVGRSEM